MSKDIYWVSLYILTIILETVVYADVRGEEGKVYYQVEHTAGRLHCYYKTNLTGWVDIGNQSTYHGGYAECSGWTKGNPDYNIKLKLNGKEYVTDEQTAISIGPYRG